MDDLGRLLELIFAGGAALLLRELVAALKARADSRRQDHKARAMEGREERQSIIADAERLSALSVRLTVDTEERISRLEIENRELAERIGALQSENSVLIERLNNMDKLYSELGLRLQGEIALRVHLQHENEQLKARVAELETEVKMLRSKLVTGMP